MPNPFNSTDATTSSTTDAGDAHLTNAREEILNTQTIEPPGSMQTDTSSGVLPSGNIESDNSIVFGPITQTVNSDVHSLHNDDSTATTASLHTTGDGHSHNGGLGVDTLPQTHTIGDGDNHGGVNDADGHDHGEYGADTLPGTHTAGDGDNHDGGVNDAVAGTYSISDGASSAQSKVANGDTAAPNELARMSQEAARLGLGARDIALIQQLGSSVPHSSPRELAERLKSARERGGILDLNHDLDDPRGAA